MLRWRQGDEGVAPGLRCNTPEEQFLAGQYSMHSSKAAREKRDRQRDSRTATQRTTSALFTPSLFPVVYRSAAFAGLILHSGEFVYCRLERAILEGVSGVLWLHLAQNDMKFWPVFSNQRNGNDTPNRRLSAEL